MTTRPPFIFAVMMRKAIVLGLGGCLFVALAATTTESSADVPPLPTQITSFYRDTPPPHFANYFEGDIDYGVKIWARTALNTTLKIEDREYEGGAWNPYKTLPLVAAAGTTATVKFTETPSHPCWGHEFRLTIVGASAPVRVGRMSSDCTYDSIVTDSWSHLTPVQQAVKNLGKVSINNVTMTEDPQCNARLRFTAKISNNSSRTLEKVWLRWSKSQLYINTPIAAGASRDVEWQEPPGDWFDDGSNFRPRELDVTLLPANIPRTDRVWTKDIAQSCIISVGLKPVVAPVGDVSP